MGGEAEASEQPQLPPPPPPPPERPKLPASTEIPAHDVQVLNSGAPSSALPAKASNVPAKASPSSSSSASKLKGPVLMSLDVNRPPEASDFAKAAAAKAQPMAASAAAPATPAQQQARTAKEAAKALLAYVSPRIRAGQLSELGTKDAPNDFIANAQRDMRLIASDGVYGPKTQARGKELLGLEFPSRTSNKKRAKANAIDVLMQPPPEPKQPPSAIDVLMQPPPAPPPPGKAVPAHSPLEAASALLALVTHAPVDWGTKARPNKLIAAAQKDMGGLTADGVYGPKTQARGAALLHKPFPARG
jgi:hypothetical protein